MANMSSFNIKGESRTYDMEEKNQLGPKAVRTSYSGEGSTPSTVKAPVFSPAAGSIGKGESVTITCATEGATIYYTTDGSTPTSESTEYTAAIEITESVTIKAIAYATIGEVEKSSAVKTAAYTVTIPTVATPVITAATANVTITCSTSDATIYYTTDGSTPTSESTEYTAAFTVSKGTTVKAIAVKEDYNNSSVASKTVTWTAANYYGLLDLYDVVAEEHEDETVVVPTTDIVDKYLNYALTEGTLVTPIQAGKEISIPVEDEEHWNAVVFMVPADSSSQLGTITQNGAECDLGTCTAEFNGETYNVKYVKDRCLGVQTFKYVINFA